MNSVELFLCRLCEPTSLAEWADRRVERTQEVYRCRLDAPVNTVPGVETPNVEGAEEWLEGREGFWVIEHVLIEVSPIIRVLFVVAEKLAIDNDRDLFRGNPARVLTWVVQGRKLPLHILSEQAPPLPDNMSIRSGQPFKEWGGYGFHQYRRVNAPQRRITGLGASIPRPVKRDLASASRSVRTACMAPQH